MPLFLISYFEMIRNSPLRRFPLLLVFFRSNLSNSFQEKMLIEQITFFQEVIYLFVKQMPIFQEAPISLRTHAISMEYLSVCR